jgi:predicted transcriptional regulator
MRMTFIVSSYIRRFENSIIDIDEFSESEKRQIDLQKRKDKIIALLNNCYDKEDQEEEQSEVLEEVEDSPRTLLKKKLGV